ncbi:MAG: MBL fold metallo-hydrolase, partial [Rhodospirillales bacterium]|nr:MBL fold metallo-hydrolase [Rhodospirillales bacterium]
MSLLTGVEAADPGHAIQIADRVWWVGHYLKDDVFQCHVYLIEHGNQSILFDPGSELTFPHTFRKIEEVIPFSNIRYFVCHHQDPDITAAMPLIDRIVSRDDAVLVTHWRAQALLKHYGLKMKFWHVEENNWELDLGGRLLKFVFTPYAHFPGAFTTFDTQEGVLFSSDIFGGFTEGFSLIAQDESYFEAMRPFHEHYMPSRDVLLHTLNKVSALPVKTICPQHGSIIPRSLVTFMIERLKTLDCGLYLLAQESTDIHRLSRLNQILRDIMNTMIIYRDFQDVASALLKIAQRILPARSIEFYTVTDDPQTVLHLAQETRFRGIVDEAPPAAAAALGLDRKSWTAAHRRNFTIQADGADDQTLLVPLFSPDRGIIQAMVMIHL